MSDFMDSFLFSQNFYKSNWPKINATVYSSIISFSLPCSAENNTNILSNFGHKVVNSSDFVYIGQSENLIIFNHMVNSDERGR